MGRQLVAQAFLMYAHVLRDEPKAMVCLVFMANTAKDPGKGVDDPAMFYMGNKALAEQALGRSEPTESDLRMLRRWMTVLRNAGAITTVKRAAPGRRMATYRLNLDLSVPMEDRTPGVLSDNPLDTRTQDAGRPITPDAGRPMHVGRQLRPTKGKRLIRDRGKSGGQTPSHPPRENRSLPNTATDDLTKIGLRAGQLRAIPGGRPDDDTDARPVQLPLLAIAPAPPAEPVIDEGVI